MTHARRSRSPSTPGDAPTRVACFEPTRGRTGWGLGVSTWEGEEEEPWGEGEEARRHPRYDAALVGRLISVHGPREGLNPEQVRLGDAILDGAASPFQAMGYLQRTTRRIRPLALMPDGCLEDAELARSPSSTDVVLFASPNAWTVSEMGRASRGSAEADRTVLLYRRINPEKPGGDELAYLPWGVVRRLLARKWSGLRLDAPEFALYRELRGGRLVPLLDWNAARRWSARRGVTASDLPPFERALVERRDRRHLSRVSSWAEPPSDPLSVDDLALVAASGIDVDHDDGCALLWQDGAWASAAVRPSPSERRRLAAASIEKARLEREAKAEAKKKKEEGKGARLPPGCVRLLPTELRGDARRSKGKRPAPAPTPEVSPRVFLCAPGDGFETFSDYDDDDDDSYDSYDSDGEVLFWGEEEGAPTTPSEGTAEVRERIRNALARICAEEDSDDSDAPSTTTTARGGGAPLPRRETVVEFVMLRHPGDREADGPDPATTEEALERAVRGLSRVGPRKRSSGPARCGGEKRARRGPSVAGASVNESTTTTTTAE